MVQLFHNAPFPPAPAAGGSLRCGEGNDAAGPGGGELLLCTVPQLISNLAGLANCPEARRESGSRAALTRLTP